MKRLLLLLIIPFLSFGQNYSPYYGTYNVNANVNSNINANVNINKKVNVSGRVTKTIRTIDYGALANANAQKETNRIARMQLAREKEREAVIAIALDPTKALDYGYNVYLSPVPNSVYKPHGLRNVSWGFTEPHDFLFQSAGGGVKLFYQTYRNVSENNIITEFNILPPNNIESKSYSKKNMLEWEATQVQEIYTIGAEQYAKGEEYRVGEVNTNFKSKFIHKKDINKTKVYGKDGFLQTIIWEDDYEYGIIDHYIAKGRDNVIYRTSAEYRGDKDEISFEDLEGRRYYLKRLIDQIMFTLRIEYQKRQ